MITSLLKSLHVRWLQLLSTDQLAGVSQQRQSSLNSYSIWLISNHALLLTSIFYWEGNPWGHSMETSVSSGKASVRLSVDFFRAKYDSQFVLKEI